MREFTLALGVLLVCAMGVRAAPNYSHIELLSAASAVGDGAPLLLGILIAPRAGWKTYWRAPGENGLPPVMSFTAHDNAGLPQIKWPAPKRLVLQGMESYGYDGPVIFPFYVQPRNNSRPVHLEIQVDYAVCLDICVPEQAVLELTVPPGPATATTQLEALQAALRKTPDPQDKDSPLRIVAAYVVRNRAKAELRIEAEATHGFQAPDLFVDGAPELMFSAPKISYSKGRDTAIFSLDIQQLNPSQPFPGQTVVLTLTDGETAIEKHVKLAQRSGTE